MTSTSFVFAMGIIIIACMTTLTLLLDSKLDKLEKKIDENQEYLNSIGNDLNKLTGEYRKVLEKLQDVKAGLK